jgi:hypothetical protein
VDRFAVLSVVADASPVLWLPGPINAVIGQQVPDHCMERIWPLEDLP